MRRSRGEKPGATGRLSPIAPGWRERREKPKGAARAAPFYAACVRRQLVVVALVIAFAVIVGRRANPDDDTGVAAVRNAPDVAGDVDLSVHVLSHPQHGQRDLAAGKHGQLTDVAKAVTAAARVTNGLPATPYGLPPLGLSTSMRCSLPSGVFSF